MNCVILPDEKNAWEQKAASINERVKKIIMENSKKFTYNTGNADEDFEGINSTLYTDGSFLCAKQSQHRIKTLLQKAEILKNPINPEKAGIGKRVVCLINGEEKSFVIGGYETPIEGRVSYLSPIAQEIQNLKAGENAYYKIGDRTFDIEILSVEVAEEAFKNS